MWLYWAQLIFNFLWSIIFFGQRNIGLALVDLIFLWIVVAIITVMFFKIHKPSGWLFLPYIIWISFALALNISLWTLNQNPVMNPYLPYVTPPTSDVVNDVVFICSNNKSVRAVFHTTEKVNLTLSDGRAVVLPLGRSADGARYVNADESFVFWNIGNTATIQENNVTTYDGCSTK